MNKGGTVAGLIVGVVVGGFIGFLGTVVFVVGGFRAHRVPSQPPQVAGQPVPEQRFSIDFSKPYDLLVNGPNGLSTYRHCTILGFTGPADEERGGLSTKGGFRYFDHWLAARLADGRLLYFPPSSIHAIEESAAKP